MRSIGIVRRIDELGRIVIPAEIRKKNEIAFGDPIEFSVDGEAIVIEKFKEKCVFCKEPGELIEFKGKMICTECMSDLL